LRSTQQSRPPAPEKPAVVSPEVKGLATQTGKATGEITRHIVSIEQTSRDLFKP
jgi:hypothetical protein